MQVRQLRDVIEQDVRHVVEVSLTNDDWTDFGIWFADLHGLDREKLDFILPDEFVFACLEKYPFVLFWGRDNHIRSRRAYRDEEEISAAQAFRRFGGDAVYEAYEYGSFHLPSAS